MSSTATHPEAFVLLHIHDVSLTAGNGTETGTLALECVTLAPDDDDKSAPLAASLSAEDRSLYLVLRLNSLELPLDPTKPISVQVGPDGGRTYTFQAADTPVGAEPSLIRLTIPIPPRHDAHRAETVEAFDHILAQYTEVEGIAPEPHSQAYHEAETRTAASHAASEAAAQPEDLRGKLVLMDEESGEVVGELPSRVHITEDPALAKAEKGKDGEPAPVLLELPPDVYDAYTGQGTSVVPYHEPESELEEAREIFVRAIPPEDQDWITKSATFISQAISTSTSMLLSGLTHAAGYYISHSTPSPHASGSQTPKDPNAPPPPPPRALLLLSHPKTHATLSRAYAISGQAVRVSQKTVGVVESMIRRAVGGQDKPKPAASSRPVRPTPTPAASAPAIPIASSSSSLTDVPPPPYPGSSPSQEALDGKPPLPPRRGAPPPLPPRSRSKSPVPPGTPQPPSQPTPSSSSTSPLPPPRPLKKHEKLLLSANLVLATVDDSAKRMLDVGSAQLTAVVGHKYGAGAGRTTELATHTARNVTLVYIDMQGLARRALIKKAGKEWVKARLGGRRGQKEAAQMDGVVVDKQAENEK
ncbi:hypothetical protein GY45DRAFT_342417 [Cubamyces sp. BRFM 1775]|nr:hypothetical protein GY45DRAFT_342417 [Cubamyces sp. BRFM 1775]